MTQVTSLELSKKLVEAGLKIKTEKCWTRQSKQDNWKILVHKIRGEYHIDYILPAFSTDELLAVMSDRLRIMKEEMDYIVNLPKCPESINMILPEALGKMCLWLLENGYHYNPETKMIEEGL